MCVADSQRVFQLLHPHPRHGCNVYGAHGAEVTLHGTTDALLMLCLSCAYAVLEYLMRDGDLISIRSRV